MASCDEQTPSDAKSIKAVLDIMGVESYDARVVNQFLEFVHRQTTEVLELAQQYATVSDKKAVDDADVQLAIEAQALHSFTPLPNRQIVIQTSASLNRYPLPDVPKTSEREVRLPKVWRRPSQPKTNIARPQTGAPSQIHHQLPLSSGSKGFAGNFNVRIAKKQIQIKKVLTMPRA